MKETVFVVTIDGPSGSGKGTLCSLLAKKLGWRLLDSGSLYRLTAFSAMNRCIPLDNEQALSEVGAILDIDFVVPDDSGPLQIYLEGEQVEQAIRQEKVGLNASKVAQFQEVRNSLLVRQRAFAKAPGLIADGRDMGTIVFPDAQVKIFLTASAEERASRRYLQLKEQGVEVSFNQVLADVKERDYRDTNRKVAPLKPAEDAIVIDNTSLSIQKVFDKIIDILSIKRII